MGVRYAQSLNAALARLLASNPRVFVYGEDIEAPYGGAFKVTQGLSTSFPERVRNTPICEAALTGLAVGMAMGGLRPVLEIMFADFLTLCMDQLVNSACKFPWISGGTVSVPMVLRTPCGGGRGYGPTHSQCLEPLFLGVPELTVVCPSIFHDPGAVLAAAVLDHDGPLLFIEPKRLYPQPCIPTASGRVEWLYVHESLEDDARFPTVVLTPDQEEPPEVTIAAYGISASLAFNAAKELFMKEEIVSEVVAPSLVKPFPVKACAQSVRRSGRLVVVEEAPVTAGWGAELAARMQGELWNVLKGPVQRVGAAEAPVACAHALERAQLPEVQDVVRAVKRTLEWR